ncbi:hypothetical protein ACFWY9_09830 [Amycolatopsis sp. NPDC059027]|uniref:hypothetical protein n=1 Tax=unclassified Amycolatopsis TaxID=2618356 RepID=UPI00366F8E03
MRAGWGTAVVALALLLSGCQAAVQGSAGLSAGDRQLAGKRAQQRAAVDTALTALEQAPALAYGSTLPGGDQQWRVTRGGSAVGVLPIEGQPVQVAIAAGQLYLAANPDYWKAHGPDDGAQFGTSWVRSAPSELPLDPAARLAPAKVAAGLRTALSSMDQVREPVRAKLPDGTEVYEVGSGLGKLRVTTAQPNRVVSFAPALLDQQAGAKLGTDLRVEPITGDALKKFHSDLDAAVGAIGQPLDALARASVTVLGDKLDCKDYDGTCKTTVDLTSSVVGGGQGTSVHVTLTVEVSADSLGAQTCKADGNTAPEATLTLACDVRFQLPNKTASYRVLAKPTAVGEVRAPVDVEKTKQAVQSDFATIGG